MQVISSKRITVLQMAGISLPTQMTPEGELAIEGERDLKNPAWKRPQTANLDQNDLMKRRNPAQN